MRILDSMDYTSILESLGSALEMAVSTCARNVDEIGILFSGGLDSSLIAKLCLEQGLDATLYSAAVRGSHDWKHIPVVATSFDCSLKLREVMSEDIERYARAVIAATGRRHAMDVAIGIPFYAACESAASDDKEAILIGQGADELFAGYHRYLRTPRAELAAALAGDLEKLRTSDIKRDEAIARANGLELRAPYLDDEVIEVASAIPLEFKLKEGVRKYILREVARRHGLPNAIVDGSKKAVQYSTGTEKLLEKMAKDKGMDTKEYLSSL